MSQILRVTKVSGFTVVQNATIRDKRLSWKATGLLMYLLSCAEGWEFNIADLSTRKKDKDAATRSAKDELVKFGYLSIEPIRIAGKFIKWEWHVYEEPIIPSSPTTPDVENPHVENPHVEFPDVEKPAQRNNKPRSNSFNKKQLLLPDELRFSRFIHDVEILKPQVAERFSDVETSTVQAALDELAAALEGGRKIENPILWMDGTIKKGVARTAAGIKKSEQRKAA